MRRAGLFWAGIVIGGACIVFAAASGDQSKFGGPTEPVTIAAWIISWIGFAAAWFGLIGLAAKKRSDYVLAAVLAAILGFIITTFSYYGILFAVN